MSDESVKKELLKEEIISALEDVDNTDLEETDKYVMRELFRGTTSDLPFKTEVNIKQIGAIVRLRTLDKIFKATEKKTSKEREKYLDSVLQYMIDVLLKMNISKDRKGRTEFVKAWLGTMDKDSREDISKWIGKF